MTHHWIDTSLPKALRDKHELFADVTYKIEQCFFCGIVKTEANADDKCDKRPKRAA